MSFVVFNKQKWSIQFISFHSFIANRLERNTILNTQTQTQYSFSEKKHALYILIIMMMMMMTMDKKCKEDEQNDNNNNNNTNQMKTNFSHHVYSITNQSITVDKR